MRVHFFHTYTTRIIRIFILYTSVLFDSSRVAGKSKLLNSFQTSVHFSPFPLVSLCTKHFHTSLEYINSSLIMSIDHSPLIMSMIMIL